ncbi:Fungal specific transcription factor domain family protein [Candida albicans]|uniref:Fungal specific transcription factor domain family protein n=1 Tax=Candida albicans TaxID=5476 RepID=A0A8H6BRA9_CANAX|nr:Fungal specific transcription factor domain family protein [Candida albicans]
MVGPYSIYTTKTGNVKSQPIKFTNKDDEQLDENNNSKNNNNSSSEFFQRRKVGFVKWDEPYETYEDMDSDLSILHGSGEDPIVKLSGETKLKGPFGVFKGEPSPQQQNNIISQEISLKSKKRRLNNSHNDTNVIATTTTTTTTTGTTSNVSNTYTNGSSPLVHGHNFTTTTTTESNSQPHGYNLETGIPHSDQPQDSQWISNELKDAALVTAAALDTQFLDLMFNFNSNIPTDDTSNNINNNTTTNTHTHTDNQTNNNNNNTGHSSIMDEFNNPDFLNLLFHKNSQLAITTPQPHIGTTTHTTTPQLSHSNSSISLANILNQNQGANNNSNSILMDPTYYSNFSNFFYNNPYQSNENLEIDLHAKSIDHDHDHDHDEDEDDESPEEVDGNDSKLLQFIMKIVKNPTNLPFDLSLPSNSNEQPTTTTGTSSSSSNRYTFIPLTESPWKTIYFPRALMALGELSALGKTSTAKNALLNALLAVSAFNLQSIALRNQASLFIKQLLHNKRNNKRNKTNGIEYCINHEKYKDVLCAVLSMISVDLVWGTMQDTRIYITWCGKVIIAKMQNKKKLSTKASILHRIFSNLKLIQDSTCLDIDSINEDFETNYYGIGIGTGTGIGYDVSGDKYVQQKLDNSDGDATTTTTAVVDDHKKVRKTRIDFIVNNTFTNKKQTKTTTTTTTNKSKSSITTSPSFVNKKLINTMKNDESFATDALYGLPYSLIVLFSETVELLRTKIYYRDNPKAAARIAMKLSNHEKEFNDRIEELNEKLENWTLDWQLYEQQQQQQQNMTTTKAKTRSTTPTSSPTPTDGKPENEEPTTVGDDNDNDDNNEFDHKFYSPMHKATYHHIMSFYHALMIYFNRLIKQIPAENLQNQVKKTLQHLNAIQKLIDDKEANIIPLFWQGFIAGCEAIEPDLQLAFKQWGADIAKYLGSYWGARQIMMEVWRRKRANEIKDDWISVIHDWEMNLMLA